MKKIQYRKNMERGRTILETIGVLVVLVLLVWGTSEVFGILKAKVIAKDINENVSTQATIRLHDLMSKPKSGKNREVVKGTHDLPIEVANGTRGSLEQVFYVQVVKFWPTTKINIAGRKIKN